MNRVKEAVLAILFMLFTLSTFAQTGSVKSRIIDAKTKKPLEFVNVSIRAIETQKPLTGTVSDSTGVFRINRVKNGTPPHLSVTNPWKKNSRSLQQQET